MTKIDDQELTVIRCHDCGGTGFKAHGDRCRKCDGSGSLFWVYANTFPYTPAGEKRARAERD